MLNKQDLIFLIVLTLFLGSYFHWEYCCEAIITPQDARIESKNNTSSVSKNYFHVYDDANPSFSIVGKDNFSFEKSNASFTTPISSDLNNSIQKLKNYINTNNNKKLAITGGFVSDELTSSKESSLGLERALSVKSYLKEAGIPEDKMIVNEVSEDSIDIINELYRDAIRYDIRTEVPAKKPESNSIVEEFNADPVIIMFHSGRIDPKISKRDNARFNELRDIINKNPSLQVSIVGHSDNIESTLRNSKIALDRAKEVKSYMTHFGIRERNLMVRSAGGSEPIASNETNQGRSQNRRVEIHLKN